MFADSRNGCGHRACPQRLDDVPRQCGQEYACVGFEAGYDLRPLGECIRTGKALRCDDAQTDPRVNTESCQWLDIRSILAAPVQYERQVVGLIEIFSNLPFAFDDGDVAVVERLAQTVLLTMSQSAHSKPK